MKDVWGYNIGLYETNIPNNKSHYYLQWKLLSLSAGFVIFSQWGYHMWQPQINYIIDILAEQEIMCTQPWPYKHSFIGTKYIGWADLLCRKFRLIKSQIISLRL